MSLAEPSTSRGPNVLRDPLFIVDPDGPERPLSLGALIARLLTGPEDVLGFPNLAAEQRSYWYRFLVRCAGKVMHALALPVAEAARRSHGELTALVTQTLAELAGGDAAWDLYQPDPTTPGFLQAPTPDGGPPEKSYSKNTASVLTSVIGSKNHERKTDVGRSLTAEETVYALVEYQTGVIYGGRGNQPSQLMGSASGAGSGVPFMGVRLSEGYAATFRHDVSVLLSTWDDIRSDLKLQGSVWALWTLPWDGKTELPADKLDPAFIPFARLVRLGPATADGRFDTVWFKPTDGRRVRELVGGGRYGDIFAPMVRDPKNPDSLKVRGTLDKGYDYQEAVRLLFGHDARPSPTVAALQDPRAAVGPEVRVVFEGTSFHQGKTGGFHRREFVLPASSVRSFLANPHPVRVAHDRLLGLAGQAKSAVRGAARVLLAGTAKPRDGDDGKVEPPARLLEESIDRIYLDILMAAAEREARGDEGYVQEWAMTLSELAEKAFREALRSIPTSGARRYEREIRAGIWLDYRLRMLRGEVTPIAPNHDSVFQPETEEAGV